MPRYSPSGALPGWDALHEESLATAGHFTAAEALAHHISPALLRYHLAQGHVEKVRRGIYRFTRHPRTLEDEYVATWLWSGRQGVFSHETALMLHQLSDAFPRQHHLTVPAAWRGRRLVVPPRVELYFADVPEAERDWYGPVPRTNVLRTLLDMAEDPGANAELYLGAMRDAQARGLLTREQLQRVKGVATWPRERADAQRKPHGGGRQTSTGA